MAHQILKYQLYPFWNDEYKKLDYINEQFNNLPQIHAWQAQGYTNRFTGDMCDMRGAQPSWNKKFLDLFASQGWQDIGTSYYRMNTGTVLPTHTDLYVKYIQLFGLQGKENTIRRAIVFLEDWQPGHYAEYMDQAFEIGRAHV